VTPPSDHGEEDRIVARIEKDLDSLEQSLKEYVRKDVFDAVQQTLDSRIKPLEWQNRLLIGLVLTGVVGAAIALITGGGVQP
jgi:hypothetical protein